MRTMTLFCLSTNLSPLPKLNPSSSTKILPSVTVTSRRRTLISGIVMPFLLNLAAPLSFAHQILDQEDNLVQLFKLNEDEDAKVEGTGSGFIWDKYGHIVTNYHVVAKLATDTNGLQRCKVSLVDAKGNSFYREGKIIGFDPAYDLAVLKVDVDGYEIKPALIGQSNNLHVGQSCFAIGNPFGYENTLTTGVVSGLGREIPSPNGGAIKGAIQTDAPINAGKLYPELRSIY
ncbi:PREDICTED: protease Do-like 5, chloroplastic isoform X2 [Lupinus angustifolius]|uniref:protease Do-like 5, chloroplastic isoform X2 n=1 Tax=Lupinus angustifolius TaxID=3871 RepID=UPI00092EFD9C|nr:PREDICTED: protease Do-like 5, chloroplastic isoform X2 [Lupinus angustifolius]